MSIPDAQRLAEARRLVGEMRAWAQVLRDSPQPTNLAFFATPAERVATHAWQQYAKAAKQLEALLLLSENDAPADQPEQQQEEAGK